MPICREDHLGSTIQYLKDSGIQVIACTEKTDQLIYELNLTVPVCIILGSEEDGISAEYLKLCDHRGKIPMKGHIGSLNVSVSSALAIYEAVRQRG